MPGTPLFIRQPADPSRASELAAFVPEMTIVDLPTLQGRPQAPWPRGSDTVIAIDFTRKIVLIGSSPYAGEMKKSVFTYSELSTCRRRASCRCTARPMSARRTTPRSSSASPAPARPRSRPIPNRTLIGDDEHGWVEDGIFNFEGGCYAKMIKLSAEAEPQIYAACQRFGAVLENIVMDPIHARRSISTTSSKTENTRSAYPLDFIPNASRTGRAGHAEEHRHAGRRRVRCDAADRQADAGARRCTISSPATPPRSPAPSAA